MRVVGKEVLFIKVFDQWRDRGTARPNLQELCCRNGFERRHAGTSYAKGEAFQAISPWTQASIGNPAELRPGLQMLIWAVPVTTTACLSVRHDTRPLDQELPRLLGVGM
jgi:hypothetical protein